MAKRQLIKAQANYSAIVAQYCGEWYPPKDSFSIRENYIKGKDSIITDTFKVDCSDPVNENQVVSVPFEKGRLRVDTVEKIVTKTQENTAKVKGLESELEKYKSAAFVGLGLLVGIIILVIILFKSNKNTNGKEK